MTVIAGHLYAALAGIVVLFQIALVFGAPWGRLTQGGRQDGALSPSARALAALSVGVLVFLALAILSAAGFPGLGWPRWTGWVALVLTLLTTMANLATPSEPERRLWGPVTLVMSALALVVMTAP